MSFKPLYLILISSLIFAACSPVVVVDVQKTFQGYPCGDQCEHFQQGFELARSRQYKQVEQCSSLSRELQLGCQSYIHEYTVENVLPPFYQFVSP